MTHYTCAVWYADPLTVGGPQDCVFYHTIDLPGLGTMPGYWDLRDTIGAYLGNFEFSGKRTLDVGTAGGFLTFEMERRGAEVVSYDMDSVERWEGVPFADPRYDGATVRERLQERVSGYRNAYWLSHRLLGSHARVYYGNLYTLPQDLGRFDVAMFGMILPHIRDPFRALESVARLVDETILITQQAPHQPGAWAYFMPDPSTLQPDNAWWSMSEECVERMRGVLRFQVESLTRAVYDCPIRGDTEECSSFRAQRTHPVRR